MTSLSWFQKRHQKNRQMLPDVRGLVLSKLSLDVSWLPTKLDWLQASPLYKPLEWMTARGLSLHKYQVVSALPSIAVSHRVASGTAAPVRLQVSEALYVYVAALENGFDLLDVFLLAEFNTSIPHLMVSDTTKIKLPNIERPK